MMDPGLETGGYRLSALDVAASLPPAVAQAVWNLPEPPEPAAWLARLAALAEDPWLDPETPRLNPGRPPRLRLDSHAVLVSLEQIRDKKLDDYALEILAHEIGHHVLIPGDLRDHGRLLARVRSALVNQAPHAPMVANIFTDLLINDRLQRPMGLRMADVYRTLKPDADPDNTLWRFYMRVYELLWGLAKGSLAEGDISLRMESDAHLGARLARVYARDWLTGASRFAILCLPWIPREGVVAKVVAKVTGRSRDGKGMGGWLDTLDAGEGGDPTLHPRLDAFVTLLRSESRCCRLVLATNGATMPRRGLADWLDRFGSRFTLKLSVNHALLERDPWLWDKAEAAREVLTGLGGERRLVINARYRPGSGDAVALERELIGRGLAGHANLFPLQRQGRAWDQVGWENPFLVGWNFRLINPDGRQFGTDLAARAAAMEHLP